MFRLFILLAVVIPKIYCIAAQPGEILWEMELSERATAFTAVGQDGTIYTILDKLYALDPDGSVKWSKERFGRYIAVGPQGRIYLVEDHLRVLSPDSQILWEFEPPAGAAKSLTVGAEGTAFLFSDAAWIYAVDPDGDLSWEQALDLDPATIHSATIVIGPAGGLYVFVRGFNQSKLFRFNAAGILKWKTPLGKASSSALSMDDTGRVYFAPQDLFTIDGNQVRHLANLPGSARSGVSVGPDGALYVIQLGALIAFDPGGQLRWQFLTDLDLGSQPIVDAEGNVYVMAETGLSSEDFRGLLILDAQGNLKSDVGLEESINRLSTPVMDQEGVVYFSGSGGGRGPPEVPDFARFIAVQGFAPPAGPWPMTKRTPQQTNRAYQRGIRAEFMRDTGEVAIELLLEPNTPYTVERSTNLTDWTGWTNVNATNLPVVLTDPVPDAAGFQFYRLSRSGLSDLE